MNGAVLNRMFVLNPLGAKRRAVMAPTWQEAAAVLGARPDGIYSAHRGATDNSVVLASQGVLFELNEEAVPAIWEQVLLRDVAG